MCVCVGGWVGQAEACFAPDVSTLSSRAQVNTLRFTRNATPKEENEQGRSVRAHHLGPWPFQLI